MGSDGEAGGELVKGIVSERNGLGDGHASTVGGWERGE